MGANGIGLIVSWYICTIAPVPFVALRMYTRWVRVGKLGVDDYLILLAQTCLIGDLIIQQHMWNLGLGDMSTISQANFKGIMQMVIPGSTLYISSLWAIKFALIFFYKRLAAPGSRLCLVYNIALGIVTTMYLIIFFDIMFQCFPHNKRWSQDPNYQCNPKAQQINYWMTTFFNIFSDVMIICLPITMVSRLQMKLKDKIGVASIFALGFLVVIASSIRAYYSKANQQMVVCTVSMIETAISIIATSLPALRSMILGTNRPTDDSPSYGKHYELSSARRKAKENRNSTAQLDGGLHSDTTQGARLRQHGSEDALVSDGLYLGSGDGHKSGKITVNTEIETRFDLVESNAGSTKSRSPA
ncbi:hypothetical protein CC80DRAFT_459252 [Byssothecium circinans]|uniref:Rhodopsin domain-containing protein n=1 Tax=Byssothecium circinans TaxID=147558 RepID=A0A6A5T9N4_9PLEO|nr:hypothetical protein CC80DRAFT_459252 [Byssothecium circinans]